MPSGTSQARRRTANMLDVKLRRHMMPMRTTACQTGIVRTGFSAADFRLNRVIRLANTGGY